MSTFNFSAAWRAIAAVQPEHPAIQQGGRTISRRQFDELSQSVAGWLTSGASSAGKDRSGLQLSRVPPGLRRRRRSLGASAINVNYRYGADAWPT
jgi:hypothetical protein